MEDNKLNNEQNQTTETTEGENGSDEQMTTPETTPKDEKKYSDAEVDEIVNKKFAKWQAQQEKVVEEVKAEAAKLAKMNADQKKEYEMEKLREENEKLKTEAMRAELGKAATALLKEQDIDATPDILEFVVGEDADSTKARIEKFVEIVQSQVKAAEMKRATGTTPKDYGSNGGAKMSKADIMKIQDPQERQKAIAGNIELFR